MKIGLIGAGNMAEAMIKGLLTASGAVQLPASYFSAGMLAFDNQARV